MPTTGPVPAGEKRAPTTMAGSEPTTSGPTPSARTTTTSRASLTTRIVWPTDDTDVQRNVNVRLSFADADLDQADNAVVLSICLGPDPDKCYLESQVLATTGNTSSRSVSLGGETLPPGAQGRFVLRLDLMPVPRYQQLKQIKDDKVRRTVWEAEGLTASQLGPRPLQLVPVHRVN